MYYAHCKNADGLYRPISILAIDAGFATQEVYAWVREQSLNQVMAIKGKVTLNVSGKKSVNAMKLLIAAFMQELPALL
jgi:phage terminase large subunit GpA-like protein